MVFFVPTEIYQPFETMFNASNNGHHHHRNLLMNGGEADFMPCFRVRTEPYNSLMRRHCRSTNRQQQDRIIEVAAIKANGFEQADFNLELNKEKRTLRVTAAKEVTSEDGFTVNKKFDKTFEIPEACDIETVKSVLTNRDRVLRITAAVAKTEEEEKDKKEIEGQQQQLEQRKGFSFMNDFLMSNNCGEDNVEDEEAETRMKFDATGFEPEDLKVEVTREGMLKIEAERVVKNEKSGQVESRKRLQRMTQLPKNAKLNEIACSFDKAGKLTVKIPKRVEAIQKEEKRSIPIKMNQDHEQEMKE